MPQDSSLEAVRLNGVSVDLGDPFSFDPFDHQESYLHRGTTSIGLRRRPYQSGTVPSSYNDIGDGRMTSIDRASIFSGLGSSSANESMSSTTSFKRSFEEAISPINSPPASSMRPTNPLGTSTDHQSTSRAFSSSTSYLSDAFRSSLGSGSVPRNLSQTARRTVACKRRRAAALSQSGSEIESFALSATRRTEENSLDSSLDDASDSSKDWNTANETLRLPSREIQDHSSTSRIMRVASPLTSRYPTPTPSISYPESAHDSGVELETPILPSGAALILRHWWGDNPSQQSSSESLAETASNRSVLANMGSEDGFTEDGSRGDNPFSLSPDETPSSPALSVSSRSITNLPETQSLIRRLRMREEADERNSRQDSSAQETGNGTEYHEELLDVFRRLNRTFNPAPSEGLGHRRPPLRSMTMHRSTTQLNDLERSLRTTAENNDLPRNVDHTQSLTDYFEDAERAVAALQPVGSSLTEHLEDAANATQPAVSSSTNLLPSARAHEALTQSNRSRLLQYTSESQGEVNNSDRPTRPRHAGSPTFSLEPEEAEMEARSSYVDFAPSPPFSLESTMPFRPLSLPQPMLSTHRSRPSEGVDRLRDSDANNQRSLQSVQFDMQQVWGEYLLSQSSNALSTPDVHNEGMRSTRNHTITNSVADTPVHSSASSMDNFSQYSRMLHEDTTAPPSSLRYSTNRSLDPSNRHFENWLERRDDVDSLDIILSQLRSPRSREQVERGRGDHNASLLTPANVDDEVQVMSAYRRMHFPDPESTVGTHQADNDRAEGLNTNNRAPQLPSLRSRSPLVIPFADPSESMSHSHEEREERRSRPLLRPLTLSSRGGLGSSTSSLNPSLSSRRDTSTPSRSETGRVGLSNRLTSNQRLRPSAAEAVRRSSPSNATASETIPSDSGTVGTTTTSRSSSRMRSLFDMIEDDEVGGGMSSQARYRSSLYRDRNQSNSVSDTPLYRLDLHSTGPDAPIERREREGSRTSLHQLDNTSSVAAFSSRRLITHSSLRRLRQRSSIGINARRRPTLLDSDSSAVDMTLESPNINNSSRSGVDPITSRHTIPFNALGLARREEAYVNSQQPSTTPQFSISQRTIPPPPFNPMRGSLSSSRRWERFLDEVGTSTSGSTAASTTGSLEDRDHHISSSSLFSLSRLHRNNFNTATARSDIANNPANYVADYDFALRDTYEGLLHLSAQIGDVKPRSTPSHVIEKLNTCSYSEWLGGGDGGGSSGGSSISSTREEAQKSAALPASSLLSSRKSGRDKGKARATEMEQENKRGDCEADGGSSATSTPAWSDKDTQCSICLEAYEGTDKIMSLPCHHAFHQDCVTAWLNTARTCPCCRGNVCGNESPPRSTYSGPILPWRSTTLAELNF